MTLFIVAYSFPSHQWMFITDTVDAIYPPNDWRSEALLDQASDVVNNLPHRNDKINALATTTSSKDYRKRCPLLLGIDCVSSIVDLGSFFSHVSLASYESLYSTRGDIDWEAIEKSIWDDIFPGR